MQLKKKNSNDVAPSLSLASVAAAGITITNIKIGLFKINQ
jgi:hypothetical protein